MAFGNPTFTDVGGAVSDLLQGQSTSRGLRLKATGDLTEAGNYDLAATLAQQNAKFTEVSTGIKVAQQQRQNYLGVGATESDVSGFGFNMSGTGLDLLRESASQGALTKAVIQEQGQITEAGYEEQAKAYSNLAGYASYAAGEENKMADEATRNSYITAGIKGAAAIATLFV